jgi:endonuclease YncB( thermonuclease family)
MQALLDSGPVKFRIVAKDRYGRDVAQLFARRVNLSCRMIATGHAVYKAEWSGKYALCGKRGL